MDTNSVCDATVSVTENDPDVSIDATPIDKGTMENVSSEKEAVREVGSALTRLELDIACCSEKLANMNLLMMHVVAWESDFEAFASEKEDMLANYDGKALEFDILSSIFGSEVREMDSFIGILKTEINNACEAIFSHKHSGEDILALEEKLHDAEESIKQSQEQILELMMQCTKFQKIVSSIKQETSNEEKEATISGDGDFLNPNATIKMQTSEEQRHILRVLEKSLARELELENELKECMQSLDEMKRRLSSTQEDVVSAEEETAAVYAHFLEADNASAVLMGISKELIGKLQLCQLKINSALRRENELNARLYECTQAVQNLEKKELDLQELAEKNSLDALALKEKVSNLEEQLKASVSAQLNGNSSLNGKNERDKVKELEEKIFLAEHRILKAEAEHKLLADANKELNKELDLLKNSDVSVEKVDIERQLMDTNIQLHDAMASVEASQEKQFLLYSSIDDMEILIEKLKSKVLEANARADSAEDKCIILSEGHAELSEEMDILRGRLECSEASLQQAEKTKQATAKEIILHTKAMTDTVMQLAIERERLHKQLSLLMMENRALVDKLQMENNVSSNSTNCEGGESEKEVLSSVHHVHSVDDGKEIKEESAATKVEISREDVLDSTCKLEPQDLEFKLERVRTIDAGRLNVKYVFSASCIVLTALLAVCFIQPERCAFW